MQLNKTSIKTSIKTLHGVGDKIAALLARLQIETTEDLLFHLPVRYQDRTKVVSISSVKMGQFAVVDAEVETIEMPTAGRTRFLCHLKDKSGKLAIRFFYMNPHQHKQLKKGLMLRCYGEISFGPTGFEMLHPEYKILDKILDVNKTPIEEVQCFTAVYPLTEGISQNLIRKLIHQVLHSLDEKIAFEELIPDHLLKKLFFPDLLAAIKFIHAPPNTESILELNEQRHPYQKRLFFEELLAHQLNLLNYKQEMEAYKAPACANLHPEQFIASLPFKLTSAQQRVCDEIATDLMQSKPMLRLVQGDVGSGKTIVAAISILNVISNGFQVALMAPTELLAEQHLKNFQKWFAALKINIAFLSGNVKGGLRKEILLNLAHGKIHLVIGTHALFQEEVQFKNLGLVVVDEQHRFGVHQRSLLRDKGKHENVYPHQLIMTATPIPRTLAMSLYANIDMSTIDELPPGRSPVVTTVLANLKRDELISRIRIMCSSGHQAYWVCTLIEESELLQCRAAEKTAQQMQTLLPEIKIGLVHGRMKGAEKETIIERFRKNEIQLLIATTVIEVGVDVPNASLMVIENAERLGLSQLHQLRGRVGRGSVASHCVLLYQSPLSETATERLKIMRETNDGFKIAEKDLAIRGPGELVGTRQTGEASFRVADLLRDHELLTSVQNIGRELLQHYPQHVSALIKRWLGYKENYIQV